jgi:signal transduction histidine kinase
MKNRAYWIAVVAASVSTATLLRLLLHPVLGLRGVFILAILAVAISAHLAGRWAGITTLVLSMPIAAVLFLGGPDAGSVGTSDWISLLLSVMLAVPLAVLGGRFHRLVHELDQALRRERLARAEAERANRSRDEFLAVLSHELRSPLNAIVGWAHILSTSEQTAEEARATETILRNADHQLRLISDLTELSRGLSGKLVLDNGFVDIRATLEQAVDAVRLAAEARRIQLQLDLPDSALIVRGEAGRIRQIFWNLLSNAVKFSPSGAAVRAAAVRQGESAIVEVVDSGNGIRVEFLPYVFESFRQEDATSSRRHGGLGLGLAIVRHLTEAHGGTVVAHSDGPGMGAKFTVTLPLCTGVSIDQLEVDDLARPQLDGLRILVVDDDEDTREALARSLGELGAIVVGAASAAEARRSISQQAPDAIVSDIGMPDEDGLAFMRALRKQAQHKGIPAIALTAYASPADRDQAIAAGYAEHVAKPVHPYSLARVIVAASRPPS